MSPSSYRGAANVRCSQVPPAARPGPERRRLKDEFDAVLFDRQNFHMFIFRAGQVQMIIKAFTRILGAVAVMAYLATASAQAGAVEDTRAAAEQGNALAQASLGFM
mgnify:CR=1 FL=1